MDANELEISNLESYLTRNPDHLDTLLKITDLSFLVGKKSKIVQYVNDIIRVYMARPSTADNGLAVARRVFEFWKLERYSNKETLRQNITAERSEYLAKVEAILLIATDMNDPAIRSTISLMLANVYSLRGNFAKAMKLFSELITAQAMDAGVEYSVIIFQAAVLLKHVDQNAQAIEYLEFLLEDMPISDGYSKLHILAFLALVYEQSGSLYIVAKERAYDDLLKEYQKELSQNSKRPMTNLKKIESIVKKGGISESSEIWEMLGLQALERCEYVFAVELLEQAGVKNVKSSILHILAELYYMLGDKLTAIDRAERSFDLQDQSAELRNFLVMIAPEKWKDRLRTISAAGPRNREEYDILSTSGPGDESGAKLSRGEHWLSKVKMGPESLNKIMSNANQGSPSNRVKIKSDISAINTSPVQLPRAASPPGKKQLSSLKFTPKSKKKKRVIREFPAIPVKPVLEEDAAKFIDKIMLGEVGNRHFYFPELEVLAGIRQHTLEEEEAKIKARLRKLKKGK